MVVGGVGTDWTPLSDLWILDVTNESWIEVLYIMTVHWVAAASKVTYPYSLTLEEISHRRISSSLIENVYITLGVRVQHNRYVTGLIKYSLTLPQTWPTTADGQKEQKIEITTKHMLFPRAIHTSVSTLHGFPIIMWRGIYSLSIGHTWWCPAGHVL